MPSHPTIYGVQANLCRTMSSAIRLEIVHLLRDGPKQVVAIAEMTGYPPSMVSRHLSILRSGGVVIAKRRGKEIFYQLANPKIVAICDLMREVLTEETARQSKLLSALDD